MNPFTGANVVVNVAAQHNGGSPVAAGIVTGLPSEGYVNVRVFYDAPDHHVHRHRPEWLENIAFHDTADVAGSNRGGLFGAFWPAGSLQDQLNSINQQMEQIMTAQSDIDAATAALTALTGDVANNVSQLVNTDVPAIQAEITALQAQGVDTTALAAAVAAASGTAASLDSAVVGVTAISSPPASTPAPAGDSTGTTTVAAGDTGSGSN